MLCPPPPPPPLYLSAPLPFQHLPLPDPAPPCQIRLVERLHLDFVRAGARFDAPSQRRYSEIMEKLAELETEFSQVRGGVQGWCWGGRVLAGWEEGGYSEGGG